MQRPAAAGVHIQLSPLDQRVVDIRFMNGDGLNQSRATERAVERSFFREDFRRAFLDEVGQIEYPADPSERYIERFLAVVDAEGIRPRGGTAARASGGPQIVVDFSHGLSGDTLSTILSRLDVDYLPFNGRGQARTDFREQLQHITKIMRVLDAGVGVKLDAGGERVYFIDEKGAVLDDLTAALLMLELAMQANPGAKVALPVVLPRAFEAVVARHRGQIVFTRSKLRDLMRAATEDVLLAANGAGLFIFPDLHPVPDGLLAAVRVLEYLGRRQAPVSETVAGLPAFFMAHHQVDCPWETKGAVMRLLHQEYRGEGVVALDGLKVHLDDHEWVHIGANPERPLFEVRAEAGDPERATLLVKEHGDQLVQWIGTHAQPPGYLGG